MEDPGFHVESILSVQALSLKEAKQLWAEATGHDDPRYWDPEDQTYWGWKVVEV